MKRACEVCKYKKRCKREKDISVIWCAKFKDERTKGVKQ